MSQYQNNNDIYALETQLGNLSFLPNNERGLPWTTQKALFDEIRLKGGINKVKVEELCKDKEEQFGVRFLPLRRKVQNKVYKLRRLTPEDFRKQERTAIIAAARIELEERHKTAPSIPIDQHPKTPPRAPSITPVVNITPTPTRFSSYFLSPLRPLSPSSYNMDNKTFGNVDHDYLLEYKTPCWMNQELTVWRTEQRVVGRNPTITTAVINIAVTNVDMRFFTKNLNGWKPFVATQVAPNRVVVEMPKGTYDFFYGSMDLCDDKDEQIAFETHSNQVRGKADKSNWRKAVAIQFPFHVNFAIIDNKKTNGKIDYQFKGGNPTEEGGQALSLVWRIAVMPKNIEDCIVLPEEEDEDHNVMDAFARHLAGCSIGKEQSTDGAANTYGVERMNIVNKTNDLSTKKKTTKGGVAKRFADSEMNAHLEAMGAGGDAIMNDEGGHLKRGANEISRIIPTTTHVHVTTPAAAPPSKKVPPLYFGVNAKPSAEDTPTNSSVPLPIMKQPPFYSAAMATAGLVSKNVNEKRLPAAASSASGNKMLMEGVETWNIGPENGEVSFMEKKKNDDDNDHQSIALSPLPSFDDDNDDDSKDEDYEEEEDKDLPAYDEMIGPYVDLSDDEDDL